MRRMTTHNRRPQVLGTSLALAALTLGAAVAPAHAEDYAPAVSTPSGPAVSTVDAQQDGKAALTVHKYQQPEQDTNLPADGMELNADALAGKQLQPLPGIRFKLKRVPNVDLKTLAGWEATAQIQQRVKTEGAEAVAKNLDLEWQGAKETGEDGTVNFTDLPLGLYYVEEDLDRSSSAKKGGVTPSAPFFVTLPLTNTQTRDRWVYQAHVYPKNALTEATKAVTDEGTTAVGDTLKYTVDAAIPRVEKLRNYQIIDPLDKRLNYLADQTKVTLEGSKQTLAGDDYTIASFKRDDDGKTYVTVEFTETGRAKLAAARKAGDQNTKVRVVISAQVTSLGEDGKIENEARLIPNEPNVPWDKESGPTTPKKPDPKDPEGPNPPPGDPWKPGVPTNTVISKFGRIALTKGSTVDEAARLENAKFEVHACRISPEAVARLNVNTASAFGVHEEVAELSKTAIPVGMAPEDTARATEFVTGKNGQVTIDGLKYNDWKNDSSTKNGQVDLTDPKSYGQFNAYCLVETQAPEGYELLPQPIPFLVTDKTMAGTQNATLPVTIKDIPKRGGFELPVTGGNGITIAATAGGLLMAGGALVAWRRRRDNAHN
ncbi:hypothetical protein BSR29_00365 [Boudabousia liubingyangii]|uniref:Gram-positive cocci surface proteins LPxTG domain-containing protein n=2 Tax=Boudabousia liubingyangii TaxID=1921764 RepID=A0A1Q5PPJ5_9ACTO|nr:hypothetical protein BSR29_00365 [Boudabousia liubingyangii]